MTWVLTAWLVVLPVLVIAAVVVVRVVDRTRARESSGPSCLPEDWFCAPIYDPAATVISIRGPNTADPVVRTDVPVGLFAMVGLIGLAVLGVLWLISWHPSVSLPRWRRMTWVLSAWVVLSAVVIVVAVVGSPMTTVRSSTGCLPYDPFCAPIDDAGRAVSPARFSMAGLIGFVLLGVLWLSTWQRQLRCPTCGQAVREEQSACGNCGRKFVVIEPLAAASASGEGCGVVR